MKTCRSVCPHGVRCEMKGTLKDHYNALGGITEYAHDGKGVDGRHGWRRSQFGSYCVPPHGSCGGQGATGTARQRDDKLVWCCKRHEEDAK